MSDNFLGELRIFTSVNTNNIPPGWLPCEGQSLNIQQYAALYSLLGTQYGGNGTTTFNLPDYRGRVAIGPDYQTPSVPYNHNGASGGSEGVVLTSTQVPPHTHTIKASTATDTPALVPNTNYIGVAQNSPAGTQAFNLYVDIPTDAGNLVPLNAATMATAGGSNAHENRQPMIALRVYIASQGMYPMRP